MSERFVITAHAAAARPGRCDVDCSGLHSYVADGRRVCWRPDAAARPGEGTRLGEPVEAAQLAQPVEVRFAVDAEIVAAPVPEALGARFGVQDFWHRWTRAEALAKISGVPILVWLTTRGLAADVPAGVTIEHHRHDDLLICTARAA